jgi:hypothetical protein
MRSPRANRAHERADAYRVAQLQAEAVIRRVHAAANVEGMSSSRGIRRGSHRVLSLDSTFNDFPSRFSCTADAIADRIIGIRANRIRIASRASPLGYERWITE